MTGVAVARAYVDRGVADTVLTTAKGEKLQHVGGVKR
jgi:hypothetical protein